MWDVSDVHSDIKEHLGVVGSSLTRRIRGRSIYQQSWNSANERTSLLDEQITPATRSNSGDSLTGQSDDVETQIITSNNSDNLEDFKDDSTVIT